MKICVFEDTSVYNLFPINYLRHTSEIICGAKTLFEKINDNLKSKFDITLLCRKEIEGLIKEQFHDNKVNELDDDKYVFLNARVLYDSKNITEHLNVIKNNFSLKGETVVSANLDKRYVEKLKLLLSENNNLISNQLLENLNLYHYPVSNETKIIDYPWDTIRYFDDELQTDIDNLFIEKKNTTKKKYKGIYFINNKNIFIGKNVNLFPGTTIDGNAGKVFISKGVTIEPNCYIKGPVYIGENSTLKSGTILYGPTSIGSISKVNGEITNSILHPFVNKQHSGFLGHSYICEWVNLGAGTTTSNLKNNYSQIAVNLGNETHKTGSIFLGSIIGDHTKTSINTSLNTGSMIGIFCNLYGCGFHDKLIKSFTWSDADNKKFMKYEIDKAVLTGKFSMLRRKINMKENYEKIIREIFTVIDNNNI
jgi:UDP-N-acetylglucosamine diphosphorylase / glucose-1-phosphate thymidylyltransferase / UDP-N-acetylgalactosamine diphosphorylase / glucosamine-1-phosphate N-acetyltransferase / galactosamine-1-phosphate N-acetyltransferase